MTAIVLAASVVGTVLCAVVTAYLIALIAGAVLSWVRPRPGGAVAAVQDVLRQLTDPVLDPLRRAIPPVGGVVDLSATIVIFLLLIVRAAICRH